MSSSPMDMLGSIGAHAVLDSWLFPGSARLLERIGFINAIAVIAGCLLLHIYWRSSGSKSSIFWRSLYIPVHDRCFDEVVEWMRTKDAGSNFSENIVKSLEVGSDTTSTGGREYKVEPGYSSHTFVHRCRLFCVFRGRRYDAADPDRTQYLVLSCLGTTKMLHELLAEIKQDTVKAKKKAPAVQKFEPRTKLHRKYGGKYCWESGRDLRPLRWDMLRMDEEKKDDLLNDIQVYCRSEEWFRKRSYPYKRGYLLHGPPGTGKSSVVAALAATLKRSLYVVNVVDQTLDDNQFQAMIHAVPEQSILLIEDLDRAPQFLKPEFVDDKEQKNRPRVSLMAMLQVLSGLGSNHDQIIFATTNNRDYLQDVLLRPGRVDYEVKFELASPRNLEHMFKDVFFEDTDDEKDGVARDGALFASIVPAKKFSQSRIMNHLISHRRDRHAAIENARHWAVIEQGEERETKLGNEARTNNIEEEEGEEREEWDTQSSNASTSVE